MPAVTPETQLLSALAELLRQGGLAAFLAISLYVNYKLWHGKEGLYDRLVSSETNRANAAEANVTSMVEELTRIRMVMTELKALRNGDSRPPSVPSSLPGGTSP